MIGHESGACHKIRMEVLVVIEEDNKGLEGTSNLQLIIVINLINTYHCTHFQ